MPAFLRILLVSSCLSFSLSACETVGSVFGSDDAVKEGVELTDEQYYNAGKTAMDEGRYKTAITNFEEIERLYPFSPLAAKAQMNIAFSHYHQGKYDDAVMLIENFIRLHPASEEVAYMYYLKALCFYERIADIKRDQAVTQQALDALNEVMLRFPDSKYARDAKLKLDLVKDHLAGKEMEIGRYYLQQKKYVAAINRFKTVIADYQTTSHAAEALYRTVEAYLSLGLLEEAQKNAAVLGHNYPDSNWYHYAYNLVAEGESSPKPLNEQSWIRQLWSDDVKEEALPRDDNAKTWLDSALDLL